ncbi:MAG: BrnT family toxin [Anaerolineae bacterium]
MRYTFEWDPHKAKLNVRNHKISFERAAEVFLDPLAIAIFDEEHSDEEERWITLGKDSREVVLVVVHTFREVAAEEWLIRVISAWKATKNEIKQYEEL